MKGKGGKKGEESILVEIGLTKTGRPKHQQRCSRCFTFGHRAGSSKCVMSGPKPKRLRGQERIEQKRETDLKKAFLHDLINQTEVAEGDSSDAEWACAQSSEEESSEEESSKEESSEEEIFEDEVCAEDQSEWPEDSPAADHEAPAVDHEAPATDHEAPAAAIRDGGYEVCINGKEELLLNMLPESLKPQYKWNGKHWRIVSAKRQSNRQQSLSGKHLSSLGELVSSDDEHTQSLATKRSRKELTKKKAEELSGGSQHELESAMDTTLSALPKSLASSDSPKSCSPKKNNFRVLPQKIVSSCAAPMDGLRHASSEHTTPQHESRVDVQIQLKGNKNIYCKETICALSASACKTPSPLDKQIRVSDAVSRGTGSGSNTNVFSSMKSGKQSFKAANTARKEGTKEVAEQLKESSMEGQLDERGLNTPQQLSRNLEINVNEGANQELPPLVPPGFKSICNEQGFLDEENVDELPTKLDSLTPGSSQCTMNNALLRRCSVAGSSLCSTLPSCQISGEQILFMKASTLWRETETMEVFRKFPQQPHFRPLEKFLPELREGLALGLMVAYASLVASVNKSRIEDSIASFKGKISALAHFQEHGFDVESLHHILNKLLETKLDHNNHVVHLDKLKESVPGKESLLNEKEKTALQFQQELESVRGELLRLKAEVNTTQEACSGDELRFRSILAELRSTLQLSD